VRRRVRPVGLVGRRAGVPAQRGRVPQGLGRGRSGRHPGRRQPRDRGPGAAGALAPGVPPGLRCVDPSPRAWVAGEARGRAVEMGRGNHSARAPWPIDSAAAARAETWPWAPLRAQARAQESRARRLEGADAASDRGRGRGSHGQGRGAPAGCARGEGRQEGSRRPRAGLQVGDEEAMQPAVRQLRASRQRGRRRSAGVFAQVAVRLCVGAGARGTTTVTPPPPAACHSSAGGCPSTRRSAFDRRSNQRHACAHPAWYGWPESQLDGVDRAAGNSGAGEE